MKGNLEMYIYVRVYIFLRCAEFSYKKMEQALKCVFGKGVWVKESTEIILSTGSWALGDLLSGSKQSNGRLGQKPHRLYQIQCLIWYTAVVLYPCCYQKEKIVDFGVASN